jgi:hypothetical protein
MEDQRRQVGLTDAVQAVQRELLAAMEDAVKEEVRFALGSVELEFAIDFRPAADGRVQVLVLSAGADESAQPVRIHRLRVTLEPAQGLPWRRAPLRPSSPERPWPVEPARPAAPREPLPRGLGGDRAGDLFIGF